MNPEIIGMIAGILTTISFFPQAVKSLKAENTKSISLIMYMLFSLGVGLWLIYGIYINSMPVIIFNAITFPLALTILGKKIYNVVKKID